jgi:PIN domain nuclease of toxin-antitoxin system
VRVLLDTHVILWLALAPQRISPAATESIELADHPDGLIAISTASLYEIAYLIRAGRVLLTIPEQAFLARLRSRFATLSISPEIAICAAQFSSPLHGDPLDRMIAATAVIENCALITADRKLLDSGVCKTVW